MKHAKAHALRIGSFNVGVDQNMLTSNRTAQYMERIQDILAICVQDAGLHVFSFCELGGHRQGLEAAGIDFRDFRIFEEGAGPKARVDENYMTVLNCGTDASQLSVQPVGPPTRHSLAFETADPQLVVNTFTGGTDTCLIHGNLHIRTPARATVTLNTRKRIVAKALKRLEASAPPQRDGASQPVAFVLVGDSNLSQQQGEEAVQVLQPASPCWNNVWHVHASTAKRSGDILFVKGAHAEAFDLPVGVSYPDTGVRRDCHDAIGVELRILRNPASQQGLKVRLAPNEGTRISRSGASQPAIPTDATNVPAPSEVTLEANEDTRILRSGASQPASSTDATDAPGPSDESSIAASTIEKQLRDWWNDRAEGGRLHHEAMELRSLLFAKKKYPVEDDVWMPGASQPGETQYVNAVVSEVYALQQLKGVIDLRETWLKEQALPMNFQMRHQLERRRFLEWAKEQYHAEPGQRERQTEDWNQGGPKLVQKRKHGRWSRELQRRLGSTQWWHTVSFTGLFDANFLRSASESGSGSGFGSGPGSGSGSSVGASQPDTKGGGASQPDTEEPSKQRELTREAQKLRDRLRQAEHGFGIWISGQDKELLLELQSGALRRRANDATERSGFKRIRNEDGTYKDIGPYTGGLTRRWKLISAHTLTQVEADQSDHPWSLLEEEDSVCWDSDSSSDASQLTVESERRCFSARCP